MRSYTARSLGDVLDAFSSNDPVPGGGSAAALAGALGTALLMMVAGITKTRTGTAQERLELDEAIARLRPLRVTLASLIDRDSDAYRVVVNAIRIPRDSTDEIERRRAIGEAMRAATDTPLQTMRACQQVLADAPVVARNGLKSASSDVGVAIELLCAAVRGAGLNVDANAHEVNDKEFAAVVRAESHEIESATAADAARARALL
ncbi:MAG TPA: cyclodeaminase/cyclohydrolase family protein [Vicinamibacterales bacterium]|nr:cyclodeaminase/cyclohydrolase family protein [Vicinamibacterales bacterium]